MVCCLLVFLFDIVFAPFWVLGPAAVAAYVAWTLAIGLGLPAVVVVFIYWTLKTTPRFREGVRFATKITSHRHEIATGYCQSICSSDDSLAHRVAENRHCIGICFCVVASCLLVVTLMAVPSPGECVVSALFLI